METQTKIVNLDKETIVNALKETMAKSVERKFEQTIEAGVNLAGINFKQANNRIEFVAQIPHIFRKQPKVVLFAKDVNTINLLKGSVDKTFAAEEIPNIDKKSGKHIAREYDLFFAEPAVMALVGKHLGQILAPRGKMPKPAPLNEQVLKGLIANSIKEVKITNKKGKNLPTLHFPVGKEKMDINQVAENFMVCYNKLLDLLPAKTQNINSIYLKTTMGSPFFVYKR